MLNVILKMIFIRTREKREQPHTHTPILRCVYFECMMHDWISLPFSIYTHIYSACIFCHYVQETENVIKMFVTVLIAFT